MCCRTQQKDENSLCFLHSCHGYICLEHRISSFFSITEGSLGEAVAVKAVQTSPEDRTALGEEGIAQIEYFAFLQDVASLPNAVTVPPGLSEFDFKFVPAPIAGAPTVVSKGWEVASVPEPGTAIALGFLGGSMLLTKKGWHWGKFVKR